MFYIFNKEGVCLCSCSIAPDKDDLVERGEILLDTENTFLIGKTYKDGILINTADEIKNKAKIIRNSLRTKIDVFLLPAATYKDELVLQENKDKLIQDSLLLAKWPNTEGWPMISLPTLSDYANKVLTIPQWPIKE